MSPGIIVSYDGTPNDDDALALGRLLAASGASLALAYVRHSREYDAGREELAQHDAEQRLERGATWLGDPELPRHVVVSASTGQGLAELAREQEATLVVFGSDYRTPPGRVEPGTSAQQLLEGGAVAVALAPAGLRANTDATIESVALSADADDFAAEQTARALAAGLGAPLGAAPGGGGSVTVIGSQSSAAEGRVALSGSARNLLESVRGAVIVVARGVPVSFEGS